MGFEVSWDDEERTILRWDQTSPGFTVEEFRAAYQKSHEMVAEIDGTFDFVVVGQGRFPKFPLSELKYAHVNQSPKQDTLYVVTTDLMAKAILGMLHTMRLPRAEKIKFVSTLQEAREMIAKRRATKEHQP
jgi:hypothetical protein